MRASIRKVGNSKGLLIPSALLKSCNITDEVELTVRGSQLIIEPVRAPRQGWFEGYNAQQDIDVWAEVALQEDDDEWVW